MLTSLAKRLLPARSRVQLRLLGFRARGWWYRGDTVHCPVCTRSFRQFLPFGSGPDRRDGAECPSCHALERNRLLWLYLDREMAVTRSRAEPLCILHVAPSPGLQRRLRQAQGVRYRSADLFWPLADDRVDLQALPYADTSYDLVLCSHVLAHVEDDRRALAEIYRILAPGGSALFQSQIFPTASTVEAGPDASVAERARLLGDASRYRNYGADHNVRIEAAGFTVEAVDYAAQFSEAEQARWGLMNTGLLYRCRR